MLDDITKDEGFFVEYDSPSNLGRSRGPGVVRSIGRKVVFTVVASGMVLTGAHATLGEGSSMQSSKARITTVTSQADASPEQIEDLLDVELMRQSLREDEFITLDEAIALFDLPT
jgi:hypothetical protein